MAKDQRSLLDVLKAELDFLERGGYRNPIRAKWRPQFIFEDSPTCLNYAKPRRRYPCSDCVLIDLVPVARRQEKVPCRHIPVNEQGDTLDLLYRSNTEEELEEPVRAWLKATIQKLEDEQSQGPSDLPEGQTGKAAGSSGQ